jgi:hypothetical protein
VVWIVNGSTGNSEQFTTKFTATDLTAGKTAVLKIEVQG